jgi:hypothetical protein
MSKDSVFDFVNFANSNVTLADDTTRLLCELDRALDHSSALRDIISRQEALQELESITGSSRKTEVLRQEIALLEQQLYAGLNDNDLVCDQSLSST